MIDITQKLSYNKILISIVAVALVCSLSGCRILKNEGERQVRQEVIEYLDENFERYAEKHHKIKMEGYKTKVNWVLGTSGATVGLLTALGGLILLKRKLNGKV